jgi:hypothetical protein
MSYVSQYSIPSLGKAILGWIQPSSAEPSLNISFLIYIFQGKKLETDPVF